MVYQQKYNQQSQGFGSTENSSTFLDCFDSSFREQRYFLHKADFFYRNEFLIQSNVDPKLLVNANAFF